MALRLPSHGILAAAFGLLAGSGVCLADDRRVEELEQVIATLQARNVALERSLVEANRKGEAAGAELDQIRKLLEALGKNLLDGGDDRMVQAAADLQLAQERLHGLEGASMRLASSITDYLRQAVVSDPDSRLRVETSLRELDALLGFGQKPRPEVRNVSLQQAKVVSIDQESGLLVLNVGETTGARIGMSFELSRANQPYGKAIIADIRKDVCGAFVERLDRPAETARLGDKATLQTQP